MREGTSGFWLEEKDDGISIGYTDFGVSEFGGMDFERTYYLDKENSKKFKDSLKKEYKGTLKQMITSAFTENFSDQKFWDFCKEHDIKYTTSTWTS
ncbi:MAG: hypothetical protein J6R29_01060 [Clostridia bacterium]|nr:hypothetical protein [Clostridia bacterium]